MQEKTLNEMFYNRTKKYNDRVVYNAKVGRNWVSASWKEFGDKVKKFSLGLVELGLQRGDTVCIFSQNCPEWVIADLGIIMAGGITVAIYASNLPEEAAYIISHSEAKIVIVEDEHQLQKVLSVKDFLPDVKNIIMIKYKALSDEKLGILSFQYVSEKGAKLAEHNSTFYEKLLSQAQSEDIITYIYTSGTTGPPKGAMLTHGNVLFVCNALDNKIPVTDTDSSLSFLPLAHALERIVFYLTIYNNGTINFAESIQKVPENIREVKPTIFIGVPRIYEKIYDKINSTVASSPPLKKTLFNWALKTGRKVSALKIEKRTIPLALQIKYLIADKLVFNKIKSLLGGRIRFCGSGGAPLAKEIMDFFHAIGITILEAYGLTETTAPVTVPVEGDLKFGFVGKPLDGVEIKIAEDGEILVRGGNVFKGYFKNPEATSEALKDGWFHTGDIGELDKDGFLKITDRKKDLIITAGGKNIAPQNIENLIKTNKYISQVVVIGDRRPYLTALLTLNTEEILNYAKEEKINYDNIEELIRNDKIQNLVSAVMTEKNKHLAKFETIKKFKIIDTDFSQETGELTPTLKVKRKFVNQKYTDLIEEMYK